MIEPEGNPSLARAVPSSATPSSTLGEGDERVDEQPVATAPSAPRADASEERAPGAKPTDQLRQLAGHVDPVFLLILLGAGILRLYGVNWDQGMHIHPDERFLTMVGNAARLPTTLGQYMDPITSPLNPANINYQFFVYGIFPVTVNKIVAVILHNDTYDGFTLQGRVLSAICDLLIVVIIFRTVKLLESRGRLAPEVKYLATFLYAISVFPIQLSHFFGVDTFQSVFMMASLYFALRYSLRGDVTFVSLSALCFGLAVASKTSALAILPLDLYFVLTSLFPEADGDLRATARGAWVAARDRVKARHIAVTGAGLLVLYAFTSYVVLRLADPYYFQSASLLDPHLSRLFLSNLQELKSFDDPNSLYPPGVQWVHKAPVIFALTNIAFFGLGLPILLFTVMGAYLIWTRGSRTELFVILLWVVLFFIFQSVQYVKTMRYFIFLYPFLAIFAGIGFQALMSGWSRYIRVPVVILLLVWPLGFMSIYVHHHSRYTASEWIYRYLPNGAYILSEAWDDPLPLLVPDTYGKTFKGAQLPSFDPDLVPGQNSLDPKKVNTMTKLLRRGDYLVLSSNRGWGSIPTVPEKYPMMTRFYQALFAGEPLPYGGIRYREIAQFTSYPSLSYLGLPIDFPDQWAEEAFTVYDHPKVAIFERVK